MVGAVLAGLVGLTPLGGCRWLLEDPVRKPKPARAERRSLFTYPWVWKDELGAKVTFSRWRGEPLVVTTIFTSCRETCPRTVQKLREVHARFSREGRPPQFLLVTLDPANDTPERLRHFKQSEKLPESWHLLTGTDAATRELTQFLDIHVIDPDAHIMHDAKIVVFDATGMPSRSFGGWGLEDEEPML